MNKSARGLEFKHSSVDAGAGRGVDVFSRDDYCKLFVDSMNYCIKEKGLKVHGL
jgi:hypothetical protein